MIVATRRETRLSFNLFNYTLPFIAFIFDHSLKKLYNVKESVMIQVLKALLMIYYIGIYVLAL